MDSNAIIRMNSGAVHHTSLYAQQVVDKCIVVEAEAPGHLVAIPDANIPQGTLWVNPAEIESVEPDPLR